MDRLHAEIDAGTQESGSDSAMIMTGDQHLPGKC